MNHHQKEVVIMKKTAAVSLFLVLALVLALCLPAAVAEEAGFLGKPFPDFTVTDTEGNTFTLSEQLKDHDAVLINFWATWCNPCKTEFPYLQEAQEKYDDRVAFIALSAFSGDSMETIAAYRQENSFTIPMGLDAGSELYDCTGTTVYPVTVIVDRFGNAVFCHTGSFMNAAEIDRVLDCFTGEDYAESAVLEEIPADGRISFGEETAIREKLERIPAYIPEIDEKLNRVSRGWKTTRMSKVDLTILRLAVYEMLYDDDVPVGVAINEAVEIAKRYGGDESASFVNGILGQIARQAKGQETPESAE